MTVPRGMPRGLESQAALSEDQLRRIAALERASGSGGGGGTGVAQWAEGTGPDQDPVNAAASYNETDITTLDLQVGDVVVIEASFWVNASTLGRGIYFRPLLNGSLFDGGDNRHGYQWNVTGINFFAQATWIVQSPVAGTTDIGLNIQEWYASTNAVSSVKMRATVINQAGPQGPAGPPGPAGGAEYLDDLLDVNVPAPSGQQVLTYNDLNMEWEARTPIASLGLVAFVYTFKTATDGTPQAGQIELNNSDPALATEMYIHEIDSNGTDISLFLEYLLVGSWCNLGERDDYQAHHHSYDVTAATNENGQVWTVPLTLFETVGGAFPNNEKINLVLRFVQSIQPSAPPVPRVIKTSTPGTYNFVKADYPNLVWFRAMLAGGGGGGGGAAATVAAEASVGGGGGGSGYAELVVTDLSTIAASESYTVGAGGIGGVGTSTLATTGDPTTMLGVTASGGKNGTNAGSVPFEYIGVSGGAGGSTAGTRTTFQNGQVGGAGVGAGWRNAGGIGGASHYGNGGQGGNATTANGGNGAQGRRGGGGGGGANRPSQGTARSGGVGGDGFIWFELWETP